MVRRPDHPSDVYYVAPAPNDLRQGDIYRDVLHVMLSEPGFTVLREITIKGGRRAFAPHDADDPPSGGFTWESKESVRAEGQVCLAVVLTHDCEIENPDSREHRLVAVVRPLLNLSTGDRETIRSNRQFGRMWLPAWDEVELPESYVDFRRITTLRKDALPDDHRIASMTDVGRELLQKFTIRYLTEQERVLPDVRPV